ncbi:MAG: enoyl-CoA hydratase/isomerase family protein [Dermatophilaceae bacterium]
MTTEVVRYENAHGIATITLNRPDTLNALNGEVIDQLARRIAEAGADDTVKVVLLAGAGRAFCSGFDLNDEIDDGTESPLDWLPVLTRDCDLIMAVWSCPKPTIAVVQGHCLAGGCELAMACDLVVAAEDAQFGAPEIRYGSGPVTLLMPFVLGQKKTSELLFTGDSLDAPGALAAGLVNTVVPLADLEAAALQLARRIAPTPVAVLRLTKQALNRAYEAMGLREAVTANLALSAILNGANSPEQQEFDAIARAEGLAAALAWRDSRYPA